MQLAGLISIPLQPLPAATHCHFSPLKPAGSLSLLSAWQLDLTLRNHGTVVRGFGCPRCQAGCHPRFSWSPHLARRSCSCSYRARPAELSPPSRPDRTRHTGISFMHLLLHRCCQSSPGFRRGEHDHFAGRWWSHRTNGEDHLILAFLQERKPPVS